jgi:hypothetical protein
LIECVDQFGDHFDQYSQVTSPEKTSNIDESSNNLHQKQTPLLDSNDQHISYINHNNHEPLTPLTPLNIMVDESNLHGEANHHQKISNLSAAMLRPLSSYSQQDDIEQK